MTSESSTSLRTRYMEQAASDLEQNRRQQQELAERIAVLKQEEVLLAEIIRLAERYEGLADALRLPEQLRDEPVAAKPKRAPERTAPRRAKTPGSAQGAPAKARAERKPQQALLGDVLADLLGRYDEPRPAKELRDELLKEFPDRSPTPQVVRNTLESLVAKGRVQRHKQQRSVVYTAVKAGSAAG